MKDKLILTIVVFLIYFYNDNIYSVFVELESWKLYGICLFTILFVFVNNNNCWQERFLNWTVFFGSIIILLSNNLFITYLGLELQTFPLFILISKNNLWIKSSEAGLKYFILGALSSGIFLLSCSLIFLKTNSLSLNYLTSILCYSDNQLWGLLGLLLFPLFFKIGLAPFHFWIPDIYEGSNWDTISILSTIPKFSVLYLVLQLFKNYNVIVIIASISVILGVLGAINQTKIKRLIAYSGITHIGFIILMLYPLESGYVEITSFYVVIYSVTLLSIILSLDSTMLSNNSYIVELQNFNNGGLKGGLLVVLIFSLAGVPPLAGFITKWLLFNSLIGQGYIFVSFVCLVFSFIGVGYYLRIIKFVYFKKGVLISNWRSSLVSNGISSESFSTYLISFSIYASLLLMGNPSPFFFVFTHLFSY